MSKERSQEIPQQPARFAISGVEVSAVDFAQAIGVIEDWIRTRHRDYVILTGAHGVVEMQTDPELREINNRAGLVTPDGMPIVWWGRAKGHRQIQKVYAPTIMLELFRRGVEPGYRHFFYGGKEGVALLLAERMAERFPGLTVCGTFCPPFRDLSEDEAREITTQINAAQPDIVWVGLGCPKQDRWMARFRPHLEAPVLIGVGAGFDFLSGEAPLAPRWIQNSGFEWFYRLLTEPKRLWPRYSRVVPRFLGLAVREALFGRGRSKRSSRFH